MFPSFTPCAAPDTSFVRTDALFATTSAKLSLLYAGLLIASFVLAGGLTWIAARSTAERELRERIALEVGALVREANLEGRNAAVAAIAARAERPGSLEYWLIAPDGERLAGDLPAVAVDDGWVRIDLPAGLPGSEGREHLLVLTRRLSDGSRLTVGDDLGRAEAVRDAVLRSLVWIGAGTALVGLLAGILATRNALARISALSSAVGRVAAGDLGARAPVSGARTSDDVDRLALAFNTMLDRITELVGSVRRVSTDVAHDLRTPLTHLQQRLEQARTAATNEARETALDAAQAQVSDVMRTFDAILRLAEIEAGTARERFSQVDLRALVESIADAYRPDVEATGRTLDVETPDPASVVGDRDLLGQALANLVENAMRHTPLGTHIRISLEARNQTVQLTVADDGPGVPDPERRDLLKPFARLDRSRTSSGSGLGLSIVAAVVRLHEARLHLSDASPGLRVTLVFESSGLAPPAQVA